MFRDKRFPFQAMDNAVNQQDIAGPDQGSKIDSKWLYSQEKQSLHRCNYQQTNLSVQLPAVTHFPSLSLSPDLSAIHNQLAILRFNNAPKGGPKQAKWN